MVIVNYVLGNSIFTVVYEQILPSIMKLSNNLTLAEACRSETAKRKNLNNTPSGIILDNLKLTADKLFQPIRDHFKKPIYVSSMYRCERLNSMVGGVSHSKHITGQAIDIDNDNTDVSNKDIFNYIKDNLDFDVLIWEYGTDTPNWVHCTYVEGLNRKQVYRNSLEEGMQMYTEPKAVQPKKVKYEQKPKKVQRNETRSVPTREIRGVSDTSRDDS